MAPQISILLGVFPFILGCSALLFFVARHFLPSRHPSLCIVEITEDIRDYSPYSRPQIDLYRTSIYLKKGDQLLVDLYFNNKTKCATLVPRQLEAQPAILPQGSFKIIKPDLSVVDLYGSDDVYNDRPVPLFVVDNYELKFVKTIPPNTFRFSTRRRIMHVDVPFYGIKKVMPCLQVSKGETEPRRYFYIPIAYLKLVGHLDHLKEFSITSLFGGENREVSNV